MFTQIQKDAISRMVTEYQADNSSYGKSGQLYVISETEVQVCLPTELYDYCERSAGHTGVKQDFRPKGIRRTVSNAYKFMDQIMESEDTLREFIMTSDKSGPDWCAKEKVRYEKKREAIKNPMTKDVFWSLYNKTILDQLVVVFGRNTVKECYDTLTMKDFQTRFNLSEV